MKRFKIVKNSLQAFIIPLIMFANIDFIRSNNYTEGPIIYGQSFNMTKDVIYGDNIQQRVDIYTQGQWLGEPTFFQSTKEKKPTLVFFHGGGWIGANKESRIPYFIPYLLRGWNVVNVEYRLGVGTAPGAVLDALSVMKWVVNNSDTYKLDLNNIVISGESSGGHLALLAGLMNSSPKNNPYYVGDQVQIKAIINWFGITDLMPLNRYYMENSSISPNYVMAWIGIDSKFKEIAELYSPVNHIFGNAPAVLTIHGKEDAIVPIWQAETLHNKLEEVGVRNQLLIIPEGHHSGFTEEQFQSIYQSIFTFLSSSIE